MKTLRWTSQDLELLPNNYKRYEIVGGELYVSEQPHLHHQIACGKIHNFLDVWSDQAQTGIAVFAPGLIFADDEDVVDETDTLQSPLLSGFTCKVGQFFTSFMR